MSNSFYRRNLPHLHTDRFPLFITFRLANSLPEKILHQLTEERERKLASLPKRDKTNIQELEQKYFNRYDDWLDRCETSPRWLKEEWIANIVKQKIIQLSHRRYKVIAYCIMPNHVHLLIEHFASNGLSHQGKSVQYPVAETLRLLKGSTAREGNVAMNRTGQFWHSESYDHIVRNETELTRTIQYILNNPIKAGLAKEWKDWKFTYVNPEFGEW